MEEEILEQEVAEEAAHQYVDTPDVPQEQPQEEAPKQPTKQELNFAEVRKRAAQAERERDELKRYLEEMKKTEKPKEAEPTLADDDLVEWRVVNHKFQQMEQRYEEDRKRTYQATVEAQLRSKYTDFDSVINEDNLMALRESYPEMAQSIAANSDLYSQSVAAYTAIKNLGLAPQQEYSSDQIQAHRNATKPRPSAAIGAQTGETPLSKANSFSKERMSKEEKDRLYREMLEATGRI